MLQNSIDTNRAASYSTVARSINNSELFADAAESEIDNAEKTKEI